MVGLNASGKSTYVAALWHAIRTASENVDIGLAHLPEDLDYLNKLSQRWISCQEAVHTPRGQTSRVQIPIRGFGDGEVSLQVPDYSGEIIRSAWSARRWSVSMDQMVAAANGVLVFVHPSHVDPTATIEEYSRAAELLAAEDPDPLRAPAPFDPEAVPTQTILVGFLQFVRARSRRKRLPVGVVVSAWDLVEGERLAPRDWLNRRLPLLGQFLESNDDMLPNSVFGVSAQGGVWPDDSERLRKLSPDVRSRTIDAAELVDDIAAPIRWVLQHA